MSYKPTRSRTYGIRKLSKSLPYKYLRQWDEEEGRYIDWVPIDLRKQNLKTAVLRLQARGFQVLDMESTLGGKLYTMKKGKRIIKVGGY